MWQLCIHTSSKTNVGDERGWQEMLRVHYRDGGSFFFSPIVAKDHLKDYWPALEMAHQA